MFIVDQSACAMSDDFFVFVWDECDRYDATTWPYALHLDFCRAMGGR